MKMLSVISIPLFLCLVVGYLMLTHGHSSAGGWLIAGGILWLLSVDYKSRVR